MQDTDNGKDAAALFMPLGVESFTLFARPTGKIWSVATIEKAEPGAETVRAHIRVADEQGRVIGHYEATGHKPTFMAELQTKGKGLSASIFSKPEDKSPEA